MRTPATAASTPSPAMIRQRFAEENQLIEDPRTPWSSIRSAPPHIVQPPRLFPHDLAKSHDSHAVMTYFGPHSTEPNDGDLSEADFDAAYLTLIDANYRARYMFFVFNAMGKDVEELLDDPRVIVSTTDASSRGWGDRLQLSYHYDDWAGQRMAWKVWVIPVGGFATSTAEHGDSTTTKLVTDDGKLRMLV